MISSKENTFFQFISQIKIDQLDEKSKNFGPLKLQKVLKNLKVEINSKVRELAVYAAYKFHKEQIKPRQDKIMDLIYQISKQRTIEAARNNEFPFYHYDQILDRDDGVVKKYNKDGTINKEFQEILNDPKKRRMYGGLLYTIVWLKLGKDGNPELDRNGNFIFKKIQDDKYQNKDVKYLGATFSMPLRQYRRVSSILIKNCEKIEYFHVKKNIKNALISAWLQVQQKYPELNMQDMAKRYGITRHSNPMTFNKRLFDEIFREGGIMSRFKEVGMLFDIVEFHKWYENAFIYEKARIKEGHFHTEGSNIDEGSGGRRKGIYRLPYYDIILLASLGVYNIEDFAEKISNLYEVSEGIVASYIHSKVEDGGLGGSDYLQEEFLAPIIKELYKRDISGIEIYKAISGLMGLTTKKIDTTWFGNWARGRITIEVNGKQEYRYFGETIDYWSEFFSKQADQDISSDDSLRQLGDLLDVSSYKAKNFRTTITSKLGYGSWRVLKNARNIIVYLRKIEGTFSIADISEKTGFASGTLRKYLDLFLRQNLIYKKGGLYYISDK